MGLSIIWNLSGFNPLPSARGDPRPCTRYRRPRRHSFNPLPSARGDPRAARGGRWRHPMGFQSAPQRPGRSTCMARVGTSRARRVSIRSPAPGEIHLRGQGAVEARHHHVSIRSPAPGEIHSRRQPGRTEGHPRFNPLPSARGDPPGPAMNPASHPCLFQSAPQRPGRSTWRSLAFIRQPGRRFNPLPSARGDPPKTAIADGASASRFNPLPSARGDPHGYSGEGGDW